MPPSNPAIMLSSTDGSYMIIEHRARKSDAYSFNDQSVAIDAAPAGYGERLSCDWDFRGIDTGTFPAMIGPYKGSAA